MRTAMEFRVDKLIKSHQVFVDAFDLYKSNQIVIKLPPEVVFSAIFLHY